jgi:hypothetical protein
MKKSIYLLILLSAFLLNCRSKQADQKFAEFGAESIPNPPTNLVALLEGNVGFLSWQDNSSNEEGFIIKRNLPGDTTTFIEIGRVPMDTIRFIALPLPRKEYIFQVTAFNKIGESAPAQVTAKRIRATFPGVTDLEATPGYKSVLLTWKNFNEDEDGFVIHRDGRVIADVSQLPPNTRYFLDKNLKPGFLYTYLVYASKRDRISRPSKVMRARPLSIISTAQHSCGLSVDNLGGGAGGWCKFETAGYDRLYDGHLQVWAGGNSVYDGDDSDFSSITSIVLNIASDNEYEYTSASTGSHDPVIFKCKTEDIFIHQISYQKKDKNWVLIDWEVHNNEKKERNVKLALFLDVDAGGDFAMRDYGGYDNAKRVVYIKNEHEDMFVGIAIMSHESYFDSFQVCNFFDPRAPDNSNYYHNGERARQDLLKNRYHTGMLHGQIGDEPTDLTMTLVANLGTIAPGKNKKIYYVIMAGKTLQELTNAIDEAINFVQKLVPQTAE